MGNALQTHHQPREKVGLRMGISPLQRQKAGRHQNHIFETVSATQGFELQR